MSTTTKLERAIEVLASDLTYSPNHEQRKAKESFWVRWNENPLCEAQDITLSVVHGVLGDGRLDRWWSQPGFKEWFRNQEEFRERAASLAHLALDTLQSILINENAQPSARVNAAKIAFEIARKMPQKQQDAKFLDEALQKMDRKQLEQYVSKNIHLLPAVPLTSPPEAATVEEQDQ